MRDGDFFLCEAFWPEPMKSTARRKLYTVDKYGKVEPMNDDQHTIKVNADMPWRIWVTPEEAKTMLTLEYGLAQATYLHEDFHDAGMRMLQDRITRLLKAGQGLVSRRIARQSKRGKTRRRSLTSFLPSLARKESRPCLGGTA